MRNIISYTKQIKIFILNLYLQFFERQYKRNSIKLRNKERRNEEIIESTKLIHIKNNRICRKKSEFPILKNFNFFLN